ncbi:MAG: T9SS type A sorting domain-containing protein [Bacteroidota bacterium]
MTRYAVCAMAAFLCATPIFAQVQETKLFQTLPLPGANIGHAVALSDDGQYAVLGAPQANGAIGAAYVFARNGTSWTRQAILAAGDGAASDQFGYAVSINRDGTTVVVGSPDDDDNGSASGAVYTFTRSGSTWTQQSKLVPAGSATDDRVGYAVDISSDGLYIAVGSPYDDPNGSNSGSVYIYHFARSSWGLTHNLTPGDGSTLDLFGATVALNSIGNYVAVGSPGADHGRAPDPGAAYVFLRSNEAWSEQQKLVTRDASLSDSLASKGLAISENGSYIALGAHRNDDAGSSSGSVYIFNRSGATWSQQLKLTARDAAANDLFGYAVALDSDGDTIVIGAPGDNSATNDADADVGAAYVFIRTGTTWGQQAKLVHDDGAPGDQWGWSVAVSGDGHTALTGIPFRDLPLTGADTGQAAVHVRSGGVWSLEHMLNVQIVDGDGNDRFGARVALSDDGTYALVSTPQDRDNGPGSGSAYVFFFDGSRWTQQAKLTPNDADENEFFSQGIALSGAGEYALIGAPQEIENGNRTGSAYVFARTGTTWSQQAKLNASDAAFGDWFGLSVSLSSDGATALVGAPQNDDAGFATGSAYVFTRSGTSWTEQAKLIGADTAMGDNFGSHLGLSGDGLYAVLAAAGDADNGFRSGSAYIFMRSGSNWTQQAKLKPSDGGVDHDFGTSVSMNDDGSYMVAGAPQNGSGAAYVFHRTGTTWGEQAKITAVGDSFAGSVAINAAGDQMVAGAHEDNVNGAFSGSAYLFSRSGTTWTQRAKITPNDGSSFQAFAVSVAMSANGLRMAAGTPLDHVATFVDPDGSAYIFNLEEALPVELTAFNAYQDGHRFQLVWTTATETNNAGFEVQHQAPGAAEFATLGFVEGAGTTLHAHTYQHTVTDLSPGRHRFRLKQVDYDGTTAYSPIVELSVAAEDALALSAAYPNPLREQAMLSVRVRQAQPVRVVAYDMLGRAVQVLYDGVLSADAAASLTIDGTALAAGLYVVRAEGEGLLRTQKVMVVK